MENTFILAVAPDGRFHAGFGPRRHPTGDTPPVLRYLDGDHADSDRPDLPRYRSLRCVQPSRPSSSSWPTSMRGNERELRLAVSRRLKAALVEGRAAAERLLIKDRHGRRCAERLCFMQDEIIRVLFEFATKHLYPAQNPSEAEHMAIVATGGYGRGVLAAGSDIDLLFLLPYKQTAWGESIAEAILYCLWDMGLKVGHATRSVSECIRQAKADMTIRTAVLEARFLLGDIKLFDELDRALRQGGRAGHRRRVRRRQARRARGAPSPRRPVALSGRAQRQGRQGRPARPAHALLDRQIRLSRARARAAHREGRLRPARVPPLPPLRRFPLGGALPHALPHGTGGGAAVLRHPARDRGAARLYRAPGPARRRTLHEALLPDRQGRRRSHRHSLRRARGQPGQGHAGAQPHDGQVPAAGADHAERDRGFRRRLQPHQRRRRERVQARSRQPDPHLPSRRRSTIWRSIPTPCTSPRARST